MDMIRKLRVRFVSIMMVIVCTLLIIIFGLVVHRTHSRIREDGLRMMENAAYAPMGTLSDRNPKRKDENKTMNILLPFFRVLIDADGKIVDMDGDYYDLTQEGSEAVLEELVSAATASEEKVGEILLDNAQKYASPQGTVQVTLQKSGAHHCLLSVSDPGDPIRPEDLKKIFQRFYRIDEARAMNHSYGLGLSIAENIVKNHKGRIWAESAEGINTFRVELPMA